MTTTFLMADERSKLVDKILWAVQQQKFDLVAETALQLAADDKALAEARAAAKDPATCGHHFVRRDGLPNAVCEFCQAELVPRASTLDSPLFPAGNPPVQLDAIPKQPTIVAPPPEPKPPRCIVCGDTGAYRAPGGSVTPCPCRHLPTPPQPKADSACPNRGAGHRWIVADPLTDRCSACKLTRPRAKTKAATHDMIGEPAGG